MSDKSYSKGLVKYTSRDYSALMAEFWDIVPKLTELWKPEAESDPGVVLGKWLASVADMLGVNLDILANELFAPSISQRKNAEKLFGLIGYELGWYTAARTEVTFTNNTDSPIKLDFGFQSNFATLTANTDITGQSRVITYNILPKTNKYTAAETRSRRQVATEDIDVFADSDAVTLNPGDSATRVAIEGELRSVSISVKKVKENKNIIRLPSQHIDTTAIWIETRTEDNREFKTQWRQCASASEFVTAEPRFAVTYDSYSNAQIQISNYLNQLQGYESSWFTIYWIDCSGLIGCVGENVLGNFLPAVTSAGVNNFDSSSNDVRITNYSNTLELPNTHIVTGKSPETAKEAYKNSRLYINTFDSLVTLPDYNRFLLREPGVQCGIVIDCQKALEINRAIYEDESLTDSEKAKMYITYQDFPESDSPLTDRSEDLSAVYDPKNPRRLLFANNFQRYTAMCFAVHNDFKNSAWGEGKTAVARVRNRIAFTAYKPPEQFVAAVKRDYMPLQAMSVDVEFGYLRLFQFHVVGKIYTKEPINRAAEQSLVNNVIEALQLFYSPANRNMGDKPTIMEIVDVVKKSDSRISYFDAGSLRNNVIVWDDCDIGYFNPISFARYVNTSSNNIRVASECIK